MGNKLVGSLGCLVGGRNHECRREALSVAERMVRGAKHGIRVRPEQDAEVTDAVVEFRKNEILFDGHAVSRHGIKLDGKHMAITHLRGVLMDLVRSEAE